MPERPSRSDPAKPAAEPPSADAAAPGARPGDLDSSPRGVGRPRDPAADAAIIEATLELIADHGFDGLRMSDVADRARVSKATMYRRWPTKHDLVLAALRTTPPLDPVDRGSLREDLKIAFGQFLQVARDWPIAPLLAALAAERLRRSEFAEQLDPFIAERTRPIVEAAARAARRGEIAPGARPELIAELLGGAIVGRLFFGGPTDPEAIGALVDRTVDLLTGTR